MLKNSSGFGGANVGLVFRSSPRDRRSGHSPRRYRTAFVTGRRAPAWAGLSRRCCWPKACGSGGLRATAERLSGLTAHRIFTPVALDLRDGRTAEARFRGRRRGPGARFDLVINNAGYGVFGAFAAADFSVWQNQLAGDAGQTPRGCAHAALRGDAGPRPRLRWSTSLRWRPNFRCPTMSGLQHGQGRAFRAERKFDL